MVSKVPSAETNGVAATLLAEPPPAGARSGKAGDVFSGAESLPADRAREIHRLMVRSRDMEERMIKMAKSGEGYFWIGGPGEEAFNACLGLQIKKGRGPEFDFLHLHYRNETTLLAMGMSPADGLRQMAMRATDPHSMGRNFPGHFCVPEWNVLPISSVIEVQYAMAPGTAMVQKRYGGDGITVVTGGDAGTAEGDFASCLVWSTRPADPLPVLIIVMNNGWGISTAAGPQHGEKRIIDRGYGFGIPGEVVDGNDPVASWHAIQRAMTYCRRERRPFMLEARVSRLHGHSSSSGAQRVNTEADSLTMFEQILQRTGVLDADDVQQVHDESRAELDAAVRQVLSEPQPTAADVFRGTYHPSPVDVVYPGDYTGLPS
ncbi:MAG: thiamine pyrophosphate-dependent dehydrogenase E1 component subunit alpha [Gemmataceae bacterium]